MCLQIPGESRQVRRAISGPQGFWDPNTLAGPVGAARGASEGLCLLRPGHAVTEPVSFPISLPLEVVGGRSRGGRGGEERQLRPNRATGS